MHSPQPKSRTIILILILSLLAACRPAQVAPSPTAPPPAAAVTHTPAPSETTAPAATEPPTAIPPTPAATIRPAPSETPSATPSPTPEAVTALTLRWVDVYAGPGEGYPVIASFAENIRFTATGRNSAGDWLQVKLSSLVAGWIAGSNLETTGDKLTLTVLDLPGAPERSPTPVRKQAGRIWATLGYGTVNIQAAELIPNTYYILKIENDKGKLILNKGFTSDDKGAIPRSSSITLYELRVGNYTIRLYLNDLFVTQATFTIEKGN